MKTKEQLIDELIDLAFADFSGQSLVLVQVDSTHL